MEDKSEEIKELDRVFNSLNPTKNDYIPCTYCGCPATDKEHVTPVSFLKMYQNLALMGIDLNVPKEVIVPSCRECNLLASDSYFENVKSKKRYVKLQIAKKYKKILRSPDWDDDEILELKGKLREYVFSFRRLKTLIKQRLSY